MNKVLLNYVKNNKKLFLRLLFFILIGIIIGVIYFNVVLEDVEREEISVFVLNTRTRLKENVGLDYIKLLINSIKKNTSYIFLIGILGLFVFGNLLVYIILIFKGVSLGFTISTFLYSFSFSLDFCMLIILCIFQNIIIIPSILLISEKSEKLSKSIKEKRINLRDELCKHILIMSILIILGLLVSLIEIYISMNFLITF